MEDTTKKKGNEHNTQTKNYEKKNVIVGQDWNGLEVSSESKKNSILIPIPGMEKPLELPAEPSAIFYSTNGLALVIAAQKGYVLVPIILASISALFIFLNHKK